MSTTTAAALSMKLLIDRKAQRVLFAEATKEVVDFLFSLLALPVATTVKLVGKEAMVGCVGNLYASVEKLDSTYVQPGAAKDAFLCPTVLSPAASSNSSLLRLPVPAAPSPGVPVPHRIYSCSTTHYYYVDDDDHMTRICNKYVTDTSGTSCPSCGHAMTTAVQLLQNASRGSGDEAKEKNASTGNSGGTTKGLVQGIVTYTVLDNLTVTPMSTISSINLLNTFAVRDIGDLQEKTVQLGYNEGLAILKASLQSKSVLSDVFLHSNNNKKAPGAGGRA